MWFGTWTHTQEWPGYYNIAHLTPSAKCFNLKTPQRLCSSQEEAAYLGKLACLSEICLVLKSKYSCLLFFVKIQIIIKTIYIHLYPIIVQKKKLDHVFLHTEQFFLVMNSYKNSYDHCNLNLICLPFCTMYTFTNTFKYREIWVSFF